MEIKERLREYKIFVENKNPEGYSNTKTMPKR